MTKDNLIKRNIFKPVQCQFCDEHESIPQLFFECIVAKNIWDYVENFSNIKVQSFLDMACKWPCRGNFDTFNCISARVCWGIWLTRNRMIFQGQVWMDIKTVLTRCWKCMNLWKPMFMGASSEGVGQWCSYLEEALRTPLAIMDR